MGSGEVVQDWYLVQTKPRSELMATMHLERQHYDVYLPMYKSLVKAKHGYEERILPMFSGYVFVALNSLVDGWYTIKNTRGVSRMVMFGETPARVAHELIDVIKEKERASTEDPVEHPIQVGDHVKVSEGALCGYEGLVESVSSQERVTLLLKYAQSYTRLTIARDQVEHME